MRALRLTALAALLAATTFTIGCKPRSTATPGPTTPAPTQEQAGASRTERSKDGTSEVILDGERTRVRWSDGDTFAVIAGPRKGEKARLSGYNTLEDYGPVHRWGGWTARELYENAQAAGDFARSRTWTCHSKGDKDGYGRILVDCPDASLALIREGYAFVFAVEGSGDPELLKAQQEAQAQRRGMWAKGVPAAIITSVHSSDEKRGGYNRVVDTRTGEARPVQHQDTFETCQEVCTGEGDGASCMTYVPYERRYKDPAPCLAK